MTRSKDQTEPGVFQDRIKLTMQIEILVDLHVSIAINQRRNSATLHSSVRNSPMNNRTNNGMLQIVQEMYRGFIKCAAKYKYPAISMSSVNYLKQRRQINLKPQQDTTATRQIKGFYSSKVVKIPRNDKYKQPIMLSASTRMVKLPLGQAMQQMPQLIVNMQEISFEESGWKNLSRKSNPC
ncbi:hypothetical protein ACOME3_010502 [Neoechinorhynchus agilis]